MVPLGPGKEGKAIMRRLSLLGAFRHAVAAFIGAGVLVLAWSSVAQAEFTPPYNTQCSGGVVEGTIAYLQLNLTQHLATAFEETDLTSPLACAKKGPGVESVGRANSVALEAFGSANGKRDPQYIFAGNEAPPTPAQWLRIDLGDKPGEDSGLIRQIPIASTAVVPLVHFPAGCAIPAKEATGDGRFMVSNSELEKVYAGEVATWGELLPDIEPSCASLPLKRVVPSVSEGTTFVFKQWLAIVNSGRGWNSLANTTWPKDSGATATVRAELGDLGEAGLVAETNGSIGYASLPNARLEGFGVFSPSNPDYNRRGLFWLSVKNGAGEQVEPTRDPNSGTDNVRGANCDNPEFNYVPSGYDTTVTPIWRAVTAVGSKVGWPICTLTYDLAWDDASTVYGKTEEQQSRQRTVKDFLAFVLGSAGQEEVKIWDYSPLPVALLADAQEGQSRVGWNKVPGSKESESAVKAQITAAEKHTQP
jgi:ABC-type phosphate transport system substrate-binding protein